MADGTPVTYEDLTEELKKYDKVKAILEADLIGSFHEPAHTASVERVLTQGALDGVDLSAPSENAPAPAVGSELEAKHGWLSMPSANLRVRLPHRGSDQYHHERPFGMVPKRRTIGYSKPYPNEVWRQQIQMAIEQGRLIFNQYAMKVDTHPFPAVNMVECTYPGGCQPRFSFNINMVGPGHHSGKDGDEGSCSRSKDTEEAAPRDRLIKRYITEGEVRNVRYQRPLSDHLLNKYVSQYDQRRRPNDDDERDRLARDARRRRRHDRDEERYERHAKESCPECRQKRKDAANVSVFKRLGPLPPRNKHAESPRVEDLEDLEDDDEEEEDSSDLIKTNVTLSDFNGQASDAQGVLNVDLTVGRKTIPTTFFIVDSKSTYAVLLGRDWIHANCCIPSTMHQCVIQWDGDEVEVVHADDSAEISTAGMNAWETTGQEPLSGINLDDCERIDVTKDGVRLVLSTGLTV
ncbi:hypothetical protein QYE76_021689 [Lolium multiflorum]|uniref:Uncharacterized protein n=1 Tax=Lolium multiflorum TaxID=4521 RepID=A0AAD8VQF0_LOLMU|nr:hypothetical protein QYE76_021689 [Lolium multiflorum]